MPQFDFYSAIKDFGFPIAVAAFLVWNLVRLNGSLTQSNGRLLDEIVRIREAVAKQAQQIEKQTKLVDQNEKLVNAIQERESQSFKLVEALLNARLKSEKPNKDDDNG